LQSLIYYPRILIEYDPLLLILGLLGGVLFSRYQRRAAFVVASFALGYWVVITILSMLGVTTCEPRYISPVLIPLALAAGALALYRGAWKKEHILLLLITMLIMLIPPYLFNSRLLLSSTRHQSREWIMNTLPNDTFITVMDDSLDLPENSRTLEDIQSYAPTFFTKRRAFLLDAASSTQQQQEYYVLTGSYYRDGAMPHTMADGNRGYLVVSWWNPVSRRAQLAEIAPQGSTTTLRLIARFPPDATDDTVSMDLANNMRNPLLVLYGLKQNGPTIDIYKF
jgi:hypothetical protein